MEPNNTYYIDNTSIDDLTGAPTSNPRIQNIKLWDYGMKVCIFMISGAGVIDILEKEYLKAFLEGCTAASFGVLSYVIKSESRSSKMNEEYLSISERMKRMSEHELRLIRNIRPGDVSVFYILDKFNQNL